MSTLNEIPQPLGKLKGKVAVIAGSLDLILSTINAPLDIPGLLGTLAPKGRLHGRRF